MVVAPAADDVNAPVMISGRTASGVIVARADHHKISVGVFKFGSMMRRTRVNEHVCCWFGDASRTEATRQRKGLIPDILTRGEFGDKALKLT